MFTTTLMKLSSRIEQSKVYYQLDTDQGLVELNSYIGKKIQLTFTGKIFCIASGELIKKSFGQGYSYKSFITLPECDLCIVRPELCHYQQGTCRDANWGQEHCMKPHVVYLAETANVKVGITRKVNVPFRWIDQGAVQAIKLFEVPDRLSAGLHEVLLKRFLDDKTDWRKMLLHKNATLDLQQKKNEVWQQYLLLQSQWPSPIVKIEDAEVRMEYPVMQYPEKLTSLNLDKNPNVTGEFLGIKGQYFYLSTGVLNIRKFQGYQVSINFY